MRGRVAARLGPPASDVWLGTFHATAVRMLRRETRTLGLPAGFRIYDRDDQESVLRELVREASLPEQVYRTGMLLSRFSEWKSALVRPAEAEGHARTEFEKQVTLLYG